MEYAFSTLFTRIGNGRDDRLYRSSMDSVTWWWFVRMTFGMDGCDDLHFSQKGSDTVYAADGRMVLSTPIATTGVTKTIVSSQVPTT